jgi:hypothetical protein
MPTLQIETQGPAMTIRLQIRDGGGYLAVNVEGTWSEAALDDLLDQVRNEADARGHDCILLDLMGMPPPQSDLLRFWAGERVANRLPPPFRVAACVPAHLVTRFGETVAVNRGATFAVFSTEREACEWLKRAPGCID